MNHNVGTIDRVVRAVMGVAILVYSIVVPVSIYARVAGGAIGVAIMLTALAATCPGYWLLGRSTCSVRRRT